MSEREQFEAWWKTTGRALCGCSLVPDHTSPNQVLAARGFGAGFAAGFEASRAQPAQAGQVLTLDEVRESVHEAGLDWHNGWTMGEDAENRYLNLCRAIEQAVLAKRVPMTPEETDAAMKLLFYPARNRAFIDGIKAAERHHGIVGEKGTTP